MSIRKDDDSGEWLTGIKYKTPTDFNDIGNGSRRLRVSSDGSVIIDSSLNMSGQKKQLLVIYGGKSSYGMGIVFNDISSSSSGKSKLRMISYAVGLGVYDLYMTTASEDYRNVEPKVRSTSGTTYEVDTGSYTIRLTSPGTKEVLFELAPRTFEDRKYYNLVLYNEGSAELPSAFWLRQDDDSAPELLSGTVARVRAANSQNGVPTVNVSLGSTRVFTNIPFGGVSSYTRTNAGSRTVAFTETVAGGTVGSVSDTLLPSRDYSVFLAPGATQSSQVAFRLLDTYFPPKSGKVRVRLVNATTIPDLGLALSFSPITPSIPIRAGSDYFEVNAGDSTPVTITQGAAGTPLVSLAGTDLTNGYTYTFLVSGMPGNVILTVRQDN